MCEELHLERQDNRTSWGFRLTGGLDFGTPLSIIKVTGGSIAELSGVQVGDLVQEINGQPIQNFTHTDAQNCIARVKNHLSLVVMRGSLVTPTVTPMRGMTPDVSHAQNGHYDNLLNQEDLNRRIEKINAAKDGMKPAPITQQKTGSTATVSKPNYTVNEKGQLLAGDKVLTDVEIAELLTGNEEVLDEGILGINFKKFLPQVEFIRKSEVFKLLQKENTKKELSEALQLKKDPNKRFSTFLQKPAIPKDDPGGPKFVHFKPPRFLPKQPEKKFEWPTLKHWERPKKPPPEPPAHSVLWLYLEEKGEEIIGGRWGSEDEERENLSRNSFVEFDRDSMGSSLKFHDDETGSVTSRERGLESQMSRIDENLNENEEMGNGAVTATDDADDKQENKTPLKYSWFIEQQEGDISELQQTMLETRQDISKTNENIRYTSDKSENIADVREEMEFEEGYYDENVEECKTSVGAETYNKTAVNNELLSQLYDIQYQIQALENEVSNDVQTQLHAVKEQLSKIVEAKTSQKTSKIKNEQFEASIEEKVKTAEQSLEYEKLNTGGKDIRGVLGNKEIISRESAVHEESRSSIQENMKSDVVSSESVFKKGNITETVMETTETFETEIKEHEVYESTEVEIEGFKGYQYEVLTAPDPDEEVITIPIRKKILPITPQMRPIVLPGGRMWRRPKDAEHEEFYQGILVAQADVLVGSTENVNYTKYLPPKMDMSTSEVYRLIHETEDPIKKKDVEEVLQDKSYCQPISKRHFYAATLREPDPIGVVEFSDL